LQLRHLRTEYQRSAWQAYDNNTVRVSLDEDMLLIRERDAPVTLGDWCSRAGLDAPLPSQDVLHFPYAVLEIKLQVDTPEWLKVGGACDGVCRGTTIKTNPKNPEP
jgi:SPX domain protein involved in polyphosphate accumulation